MLHPDRRLAVRDEANGPVYLERVPIDLNRHCEERSDEAIQGQRDVAPGWLRLTLAMTGAPAVKGTSHHAPSSTRLIGTDPDPVPSEAAPVFGGRAAARRRHVSGVRGFRGAAISGRGFDLPEPLRRHLRAGRRRLGRYKGAVAPAYRILGIGGFRATTNSGRGINLFKALRRHLRADRRRLGGMRSLAGRVGRHGESAIAPAYHILWVNSFRSTTILGRGINLFKALRRYLRADRRRLGGMRSPAGR